MKYPKVLLVCSFNQNTANGITIHNLFKSWPKDRIALVEFNGRIEDIYVPGINNYYLLGSSEVRFKGLLNRFRKIRPSRALKINAVSIKNSPKIQKSEYSNHNGIKTILLKAQRAFLNATGLVMVSRKFYISKPFEKWLREYNPDIVYATIGDICKLDFIHELKQCYGFRLCVHIFDDYINSRYQYTLFPEYWMHRLDTAFRRVIESAELGLAISDKMAAEYSEKYGKTFHVFHNPIDPAIWLADSVRLPMFSNNQIVTDQTPQNNPFTFIYAGKVNRDTSKPLKAFIAAIEKLQQAGYNVRFLIYSPYPSSEIRMQLGNKLENIFQGRAKYTDLPHHFRAADGLLLPLDFSLKTIRYIRLSMLTKATEYMISGTPIFLFTPHGLAVTEYLMKHNAAFHVEDPATIDAQILNFMNDAKMRERISNNALKLAKTHHLQETVGNRLRNLIASLCSH